MENLWKILSSGETWYDLPVNGITGYYTEYFPQVERVESRETSQTANAVIQGHYAGGLDHGEKNGAGKQWECFGEYFGGRAEKDLLTD